MSCSLLIKPHIPAPATLTFTTESLLEVEQDISEPAYVIDQLHYVFWLHSRRPRQVRHQPHAAQRIGVLGASALIPGLGRPCRQRTSVGLGVVSQLRPTTIAAAAALPEHPSGHHSCHPLQGWGCGSGQLAPVVTTLCWSQDS